MAATELHPAAVRADVLADAARIAHTLIADHGPGTAHDLTPGQIATELLTDTERDWVAGAAATCGLEPPTSAVKAVVWRMLDQGGE